MKNVIATVLLVMVSRQVIAQVDSNSIVSIRLSKLCGSCSLETQIRSIGDTVWSAPFVLSQVSLCMTLDTSFKISKLPQDVFGFAISFKIDSINNCFRNIGIDCHELESIPWNGVQGSLTVMNGLEVSFDSLPFMAVAGHLIGKGEAFYQSDFTSNLLTMAILHTQFSGGCSNSYSGMDSLILDIAPSIPLAINDSPSGLASFQVRAAGRNFFFEFPESNSERKLYVYDVLGREIETLHVRSGTNSLQTPLSLSPGQFFARLCNETIRFIVNDF